MAEVKGELVEQEDQPLELASSVDLNQSSFDAIVKFSEQTEKIEKALDKVRGFFMRRAFSGDFVSHNGKTVNVSGPGAERILSSLGLMGVGWSLTDWSKHKDEGSDKNGDWYVHWYDAEAKIGNMNLGRIEGRAGSRDKLFGYKNHAWKDLADVKEPDIQMAARRCVYKELVKVGLGMRNIPIADAIKMGLDKEKISLIEFGKEGETKQEAAESGTPLTIADLKSFTKKDEMDGDKVKKKGYTRYDIIDDKGGKYSTFDKEVAKAAKALKEAGKKVVIAYTVGKYGNDIKELKEAPAAAQAAEKKAEPDMSGGGLGQPSGYVPGEDAQG